MQYPCDSSGLGRPIQLIRRDRHTATDIESLDIFGPEMAAQGVVLLEGYEGFYHTDRTVPREKSAYSEGSWPSKFPRVEERMLDFSLGTQASNPADWERIENKLWRFLKYDEDCIIRLHSVLSKPRELVIRLDRKPNDLLKRGPGLITAQAWKITAFAYDPWWYSETLKASIKRSEMVEVNATTGVPQPGSGVWQGMVPMSNPADQRCFPEFSCNELTATTTVTLPDGLDGRVIQLPPLGPGKEFLVRTHPLVETLLVRDDSQEWANMKAQAFENVVPASTTTPVMVPIRIVGGTADTEVTMYLPQRWDRCWGGEVA